MLHGAFDPAGELRFFVKVSEVVPGMPAQKAGVLAGDLITGIDKLDLNPPDAQQMFMDYVSARTPGRKVELRVDRKGKPMTFDLVLARRPEGLDGAPPKKDVIPEQLLNDFVEQKRAARESGKEDGGKPAAKGRR